MLIIYERAKNNNARFFSLATNKWLAIVIFLHISFTFSYYPLDLSIHLPVGLTGIQADVCHIAPYLCPPNYHYISSGRSAAR